MPPVNGLFGAIIPSAIYALLGTCPQLSVGPEAALSLMTGQTIQKVLTALPEDATSAHKLKIATTMSTMITLEVGLITFLLGLARMGFLDAVLSRPLLRGFVTAVGLVIFINQLIPMLGLTA